MDIEIHRLDNGDLVLDFGPVMLTLAPEVAERLRQLVAARLNRNGEAEKAALEKRLVVFRDLARKLVRVDDRILQRLLPRLTPEQLVTLVRLAGKPLADKVMRNLSRPNRRQFQEDFQRLNRITKHQAVIYMEQIVPLLKETAREQQKLMAQAGWRVR